MYLSLTQIQVFSERVTFPFNHTCLMPVSNSMIIVNVSNYDHVEQFISSSAMSKAVADNKSPNLSIACPMNCYPKRAKQFPCPRHFCLYRCHCFQHYLVINFEVIDPYIALWKTFTSILTLLVHFHGNFLQRDLFRSIPLLVTANL